MQDEHTPVTPEGIHNKTTYLLRKEQGFGKKSLEGRYPN